MDHDQRQQLIGKENVPFFIRIGGGATLPQRYDVFQINGQPPRSHSPIIFHTGLQGLVSITSRSSQGDLNRSRVLEWPRKPPGESHQNN